MSTLNVAVIGVGLVGKEFLNQLAFVGASDLSSRRIRLIYASNSKRALREDSKGLDPASCSQRLADGEGEEVALAELPRLLESTIVDRHRTVIVDNTSSDYVASLYPAFLQKGFDVITPNKKAFSSSLKLYNDIIFASRFKEGGKYLNESTVGAGLPIIATLRDLVASGDEVIKIEGVLSGTLSYIFNEYSTPLGEGPSFSSIVAQAREKGYTEPHPGDDLNGADVARKLTILSRMIPSLRSHLPEGYKSVSITSLVPDALASVTSGDEFVARLPEYDAEFEKLREEAKKEGKVLRYVGVIDVQAKVVKAALEKYPANHAFATSLQGSDNIIAFHTKRYSPRPMIVQGAGAGAAVTAMGIMSDLLKLL
ncbi:Probable homoserine dehydrogenase Short=HDH [Serendipita indica DSM 11827]|uniref:Homoserine dehydrogenase n=1 Tax=Serendipita indica (strain DSM 11827) TaxID=1109443 RepID=G4TQY4_SERID|nr:Probable homoserine dehydrogenase Short=HDH [Serendipita indica DSM 11827]CCA73727.1 probable HOM6-homoserine dehydrogenase [Serendipita indica DSM 11827]